MSHVYRALTLVLLLLAAQQGALVHELGHFSADHATAVRVGSGSVSDGTCALCPSFAQAASPTFSHSFHIPLLVRSETERSSKPQIAVVDVAVPTPRSRGPPSLS